MYSSVFSSFGGFGGPSASSLLGYTGKSDISYDTSSRDPTALRARVFVGNLNTNRVTREDVIQMFKAYGTLAGVTLFKGYAFVQYSHSTEADLAVSALNGYNWNGSVLDVKLAAHGMKTSSTVGTSASSVKRGADSSGTPKAKKTAIYSMEKELNVENKAFINNLTEPISGIAEHVENPDTLICGECRFITSGVNEFIQHRKEPCSFFKAEGEPKKLQCFTCTDEFPTSWSLLKHLTSTHKMILYKEPETSPLAGGDAIVVEDGEGEATNGKPTAEDAELVVAGESIAAAAAAAGLEDEQIED